MKKNKNISLVRCLIIYLLGLISGIQIALYLYDIYDDGIADYRSLLIGILIIILSIGFVLYSFKNNNIEKG